MVLCRRYFLLQGGLPGVSWRRGGERERERGEKNWKNENRGGVKRRGGKRKVGGPKKFLNVVLVWCVSK